MSEAADPYSAAWARIRRRRRFGWIGLALLPVAGLLMKRAAPAGVLMLYTHGVPARFVDVDERFNGEVVWQGAVPDLRERNETPSRKNEKRTPDPGRSMASKTAMPVGVADGIATYR